VGTLNSINPFTGEAQFEPIAESTPAEVDAVVARSVAASSDWAKAAPAERARALRAIADALDEHPTPLAELAHQETALGADRLVGEIARTSFQLRLFAEELETGRLLATEIDEALPGLPPAGHPRLVRRYVALGPVAVFGAGNFPFAFGQLGGDTVSALAAGCTVIVKDHPGHPHLAQRLMELARLALTGAGFDADVLQSVRGMAAGSAVVAHPAVHAGAFTGSQKAGRALFDIATSRPQPIPFYGELGSMNPVFITQAALTARRDELASELAASLTMGRGQLCTKPSVIFVPDDQAFVDGLVHALSAVAPGPLLGPLSLERYIRGVSGVAGITGVAELIPTSAGADLSVAPGLLATGFDNFVKHADELLEECFGPVGLLVRCESERDFDVVIEHLEGALVATVHAVPDIDGALVRHLVDELSLIAGRIVVNGWPTGLAVTPWQHHGGPYPASTSVLHTSVGSQAMMRFVRPVVIQNVSDEQWPGLL
jgi:NADP-dependent aldehyde dehydrogenase